MGAAEGRAAPDIQDLELAVANARAEHQSLAPDTRAERTRGELLDARQRALQQVVRLEQTLTAARKLRTADLAKLHIAAKDLGLDEDTRRAMIRRVSRGRTDTGAELTASERAALLAEHASKGWQPKGIWRPGRGAAAPNRGALAGKLRALLHAADRPDAYADAIAERRFGVARWEWLGYEDLKKLVQMLAIDRRRQGRRQVKP